MTMSIKSRARGMALLPVLAVVVVLTLLVVFAINVSGRERQESAKIIHTANLQQMTESALQGARAYFGQHYLPVGTWDTYLAYFVDKPVSLEPGQILSDISTLKGDHPELIFPAATGFSCFMYARNNVDGGGARKDNDLLIYVGAACAKTASGKATLVANMTGPLVHISTQGVYLGQASGGTQGLNNVSLSDGFR